MFQISANTVSLLPLYTKRFYLFWWASPISKLISKTPVNTSQGLQSMTALGSFALIASQTFLAGTLQPQPPQQLTSMTTFCLILLQPIFYNAKDTNQSLLNMTIPSNQIKFHSVQIQLQTIEISFVVCSKVQFRIGSSYLFVWQLVIIFYQQTPIMFKKKHSEINIKVPLRPYSPLRSKSPVAVQPSPRNLSPMKNTFRNLQSKPQRKQLMQEQELRSLSPRKFQNHFQSRLQNQAYYNEPRYDSTQRFPVNKFGCHTDLTNDMSYFSNYSNISKDGNIQNIKQSKRLFSKCIAEMNSQKKKVCADRSNNNSNATSIVQNSKQVTSDTKMKNVYPSPVTSFKALKIQMIQSVLPPEKKFNTIERKNSEYQTSGKQYKTKEFLIEQPKKQQVIELINQSFSNAGVSRINEQHATQKKGTVLQAKAKILESLYIEQESDYRDFDLIIQKIQIQPRRQHMKEIQQSVKISMQSNRGSLSMDPFY